MKKIILPFLLTVVVASAIFIGCSKNKDDRSTVYVRLTDNPYNAEEVNVDIKQVTVKFSDNDDDWATLDTHAGVYNLLGLQNGVDTLLASGTFPGDDVKEIRLVLGTDNSIKISGVTYPLTIPSGSESGLKIKVDKHFANPVDSILIDFDAALSILQAGTGDYKLKPVLKIK